MELDFEVKVGMEFECIQNYVMDNGEIAFLKGKVYNLSSKNNINRYQFINEQKNNHNLTIDDKFHEYFIIKKENSVKITIKEVRFDIEVQSTLQKIQELILVKGKEYRRDNNPYHNFDIGAEMTNQIPEKVLHGFLLKHLVSYQDMLNDIEQGKLPKIEVVEEKFGDIILYYIIQKCMVLERINQS